MIAAYDLLALLGASEALSKSTFVTIRIVPNAGPRQYKYDDFSAPYTFAFAMCFSDITQNLQRQRSPDITNVVLSAQASSKHYR